MKKQFVAVGVDPGTGLRSPTAMAIIDPKTRSLIAVKTFGSKHDITLHRIKEISENFRKAIEIVGLNYSAAVYCENFVMRGKGGETLARMTGALLACVPYDLEIEFVHNIKMKKAVTGSGKAEKIDVANGVFNWMRAEDSAQIQQLIDDENWDCTDAIGLAIAGCLLSDKKDEKL